MQTKAGGEKERKREERGRRWLKCERGERKAIRSKGGRKGSTSERMGVARGISKG